MLYQLSYEATHWEFISSDDLHTGIVEVTGSNPVEALIFFEATSFHDETQRGLSGSTSKECGVDRPAFLTYFLCSAVTN